MRTPQANRLAGTVDPTSVDRSIDWTQGEATRACPKHQSLTTPRSRISLSRMMRPHVGRIGAGAPAAMAAVGAALRRHHGCRPAVRRFLCWCSCLRFQVPTWRCDATRFFPPSCSRHRHRHLPVSSHSPNSFLRLASVLICADLHEQE